MDDIFIEREQEEREKEEYGTEITEKYLEAVTPGDAIELERRKWELVEFGLSFGVLRDVIKARSGVGKVVWVCLSLSALGMCLMEVSTLTIRYLAAPTNTKITYKVNASMSFPIVTICTYSRLNATKVNSMNIDDELLTFMLSAFKGMYSSYNTYNIRNRVMMLNEKYKLFVAAQATNFSLTQFFIENGFECEQFVKSCMFQGVDIPCCVNPEVLSSEGKCFVIDNDKYTVQTIPGPTGGLRVSVYNWADLYPRSFVNANPDMGVQIHIIPPGSTSFIGVSPLVIFPGTHALVRLNAVHRILLADEANPDAACTEKKVLKYFDKYSFEGCFTECIADLTVKTCGCIQIGTIPNYQKIGDESICRPIVASECVQPLLQANNMGFLWDMYDIKKVCDCPLPCDEWYYETSVSYSAVPNPGYAAEQKKIADGKKASNLTFGTGTDDYIILDIFYGDLVYTSIIARLITGTLFLSQVGGQMAVWLGIRLISLGHLAYYALMVLLVLLPIWARRFKLWRLRLFREAQEEEEKRRPPTPAPPPPDDDDEE